MSSRMSRRSWALSLTLALAIPTAMSACIPDVYLPALLDPNANSWILRWNQIAVDTSGLDHTPVEQGEDRLFGHQLGPGRSSRAMAIVHIAMFDAVNAIVQDFESYTGIDPVDKETSMKAAVAQAAHDTLIALFPSHTPRLDGELEFDLAHIHEGDAKTRGIDLGKAAAAAILKLRENDGSELPESYTFNQDAGYWRLDPINPTQSPLGTQWSKCKPFVIKRADQFRVPPPPEMSSKEYAESYNEALQFGGDGITTPTVRTEEQTLIGTYWAYDGTPSLCAPPRLYNQLARQIATDRRLNVVELARLFALVNTAMADAGVAIWESKYYYNFWRPVTGIRESDVGTGPMGLGDGNIDTVGDESFVPLGAPLSNGNGPNFTPPFPAYPSGHAGFGGALFEILRNYFGTDDIRFTFVSDELNGETTDHEGNVRPLIPRTFDSLTEAEEENGQSRIYLGIHWSFDKVEGIHQGNRVADYVFENAFRPVR